MCQVSIYIYDDISCTFSLTWIYSIVPCNPDLFKSPCYFWAHASLKTLALETPCNRSLPGATVEVPSILVPWRTPLKNPFVLCRFESTFVSTRAKRNSNHKLAPSKECQGSTPVFGIMRYCTHLDPYSQITSSIICLWRKRVEFTWSCFWSTQTLCHHCTSTNIY